MLQEAIDIFTKLLIKQDFKDRKKGKTTYVKKTRVYKDVIKMLKELNN